MKKILLLAAAGTLISTAGFAVPPAPAAPAKPAAVQAGKVWTQEDANKICDIRWNGKPKRHQVCLNRHAKLLGKPIRPADQRELISGISSVHAPRTAQAVAKVPAAAQPKK